MSSLRCSSPLVIALLVSLAAGCSESHGRIDGDAGARTDAIVRGDDDGGRDGGGSCGATPSFQCGYVTDHVCGDAYFGPECVAGAWSCPGGTMRFVPSDCWCSGFVPHGPECVCTPGGWSCPTTFACGPESTCTRGADYCERVLDDTGGPDLYRCRPLDDGCASASCACFDGIFGCEDDGRGAVTITSGGG